MLESSMLGAHPSARSTGSSAGFPQQFLHRQEGLSACTQQDLAVKVGRSKERSCDSLTQVRGHMPFGSGSGPRLHWGRLPLPQVTATLSSRFLLLLDAEYHSYAHVGFLLFCMYACPFAWAPGGWASTWSVCLPPVLWSLCTGIQATRNHVQGPSDSSTIPATPTLRVHGLEQIPPPTHDSVSSDSDHSSSCACRSYSCGVLCMSECLLVHSFDTLFSGV